MTKYRSKILFMALLLMAFTVSAVHAQNSTFEVNQIESGADDGFITEVGYKFFDTPWVQIKSKTTSLTSYFAFRGVDIPANSTIVNATLQFTAPGPTTFAPNASLAVTIYGIKTPDLPSWDPTPDLENEPFTDANTIWDATPLSRGAQINVTVTDQVKEIYEMYSWNSGNDMGFKILSVLNPSILAARYQQSYENDPNEAMKLYIEYIDPESNTTTYYKDYKITYGSSSDVMVFWFNQSGAPHYTSYQNGEVINTGDLPFSLLAGSTSDQASRDQIFKLGDSSFIFSQDGLNMTIWETQDQGLSWNQTFSVNAGLADIAHLGSWIGHNSEFIHVVFTSVDDLYYWNISLATWTASPRVTLKLNIVPDFTNTCLSGNSANNDLYVAAGSTDGVYAFTRISGVWAEKIIQEGTLNGVAWYGQVMHAETLDKVVWSVQVQGVDDLVAIQRTEDTEPATVLDGEIKPYDNWKLISKNGIEPRAHTLWTASLHTYVGYIWEAPLGEDIGVVSRMAWTSSTPGDDWDQANNTAVDGRYIQFYGDGGDGDPRVVYVIFFQANEYRMYDMGATFFRGAKAAFSWVDAEIQRTDNGLFSPMVPRLPYLGNKFTVLDPNGTLVNSSCIDAALTLEDAQACIDDIPGVGQTPDDPNPPGTNYPEEGGQFGTLTRFNMRFVLFGVGWVLILAPLMIMAIRPWPMKIYLVFALCIALGFGLQWSIGSI